MDWLNYAASAYSTALTAGVNLMTLAEAFVRKEQSAIVPTSFLIEFPTISYPLIF